MELSFLKHTIDLDGARASDGDAKGDVLNDIEGLIGSQFGDRLFGNADKNRLDGGSGNDALDGGDELRGGAGNDKLWGGSGADRFVFKNGFGNDRICDFQRNVSGEKIDLSDVDAITGFQDLTRNPLRNSGDDVVILDGDGSTIRLVGLHKSDLSSDDFIF